MLNLVKWKLLDIGPLRVNLWNDTVTFMFWNKSKEVSFFRWLLQV
jgi:hypothetical protein